MHAGNLTIAKETLNCHKNELSDHKTELEKLHQRLQDTLKALEAKGYACRIMLTHMQ